MDDLATLFASLERPQDLAPSTQPMQREGMTGTLNTPADALSYMLAGNATVTFRGRTDRFTFKITAPRDKETQKVDRNSDFRFVALMNGPDNESSFQYLGYIRRGVYFHGKRSKIGRDAKSAKAFTWTYGKLLRGKFPAGLEVWHEGHCGRCGRKLTVPSSVASGFGPECQQHI